MKSLCLKPAEVRQLLSEGRCEIRRPVGPSNSTVNGRNAIAKHDAREWFDGWVNLGIGDERVYVDDSTPNFGDYLHVPLLNIEEGDRRWYRVRSRIEVGAVIAGKEAYAEADAFEEYPDLQVLRHGVAYRTGHPYGDVTPTRWHPASRMRAEYVRLRLIVESVRCERGEQWEWVWTMGREDAV